MTDVVGSTRLWDEHPEQMRTALARHDALAAETIAACHGALVKERGEGDSLFAVFQRPADALAAACALQQALGREAWPPETPLWVRMALHTGETEQRAGDYYGGTVNRCARLRAIAHGGQVLLSQTTCELVRDSLPEAVSLRDLGSHRLRDLARRETVYQLVHPALPADFPPLASLDSPLLPNNLPIQLTSFVGREHEMARTRELLAAARLLTVTGAGGSGKTRLALQVAADLLDAYPDGVWLVELAALTEPSLVPDAVAAALQVREEPGRSAAQTLVESLKLRRLLVLLDNCEHLLPACAALADLLLRSCPHVSLLVTSREPLAISGETVYRIPTMQTPDPRHVPALQTLARSEAVRLFMDRAAAVAPAFALTDRSAPAVAQVCARLDGIPLAIELAAARLRSLTAEQLASRLDDRFHLLTGGSRTALPRQQTLRALVDWSYEMLGPPERALLARLSVFSGGWTLDAAESVCADPDADDLSQAGEGGIHSWEVLDLLTGLVDKSLVVFDDGEDGARYRLLETIRQYARQKAQDVPGQDNVGGRHAAFYLALAEECRDAMVGPAQVQTGRRLEAERDNFRAALAWLLGHEQGGGLRLLIALSRWWDARGRWTEGRSWLERFLSADPVAEAALRADALILDAWLAYRQGAYEEAQARAREGLAIGRELQSDQLVGTGLNVLASIAHARGEAAEARRLFEQVCELGRGWHRSVTLANAHNNLGLLLLDLGQHAEALDHLEQGCARYRELNDNGLIARALQNTGMAACQLGDYPRALALFQEGMALADGLGDRLAVASCQLNIGLCMQETGQGQEARRLYLESIATMRELGARRSVAIGTRNLAGLSHAEGQHDEASALYGETLVLARELGDLWMVLAGLEGMTLLAADTGQWDRCATLAGAAESLRRGIGTGVYSVPAEAYEQATATAADAIGQEAYGRLFGEGERMDAEQAAAYARAGA